MTFIRPPKAPALPDGGVEYTRAYHSQFNNVLRLYFNQLDGVNSAILGPAGGQHIDCPNGLFFCVESQTLTDPNVAESIMFDQPYLSNGVRVVEGSKAQADVGGIYNFQFSGQLTSTSSSSKTAYFWIKRNTTPIGYSTHAYTLSGSGTQLEVSWNFNIDMRVGDTLSMEWASADTNLTLSATDPVTPHPGIPSAVLAVNFIAPLPAELPTPP